MRVRFYDFQLCEERYLLERNGVLVALRPGRSISSPTSCETEVASFYRKNS